MDCRLKMSYELAKLEEKFFKACDQIVVIDRRLKDMTVRFDTANHAGHRSMRYNRRLQLVTLEGVRAAFYQFAEMTAEKMTHLRWCLGHHPKLEHLNLAQMSENFFHYSLKNQN